MGPHFFKCGKNRHERQENRANGASMGPHFFKCGKHRCNGRCDTPGRSFNGAALFQVRKGTADWISVSCSSGLQWGRTFSSAERSVSPDIFETIERLQWGRTFSSAERQANAIGRSDSSAASMGPHFFKCGKQSRRSRPRNDESGFNGAALFQVRKAINLAGTKSTTGRLQWGRTFSSAERQTDEFTANGGRVGFNGAALFQVRKGRAALASGKGLWASMGPHFFKCGKGGGSSGSMMKYSASMGPHFFKCGKPVASTSRRNRRRASMGPHFFKCGKDAGQVEGQPV